MPPGRVGRGLLAEEMQEVGRAVVAAGKAQAEDEDIAAEAPEEFLDPIMSHLMTDPVILPSSKVLEIDELLHSKTSQSRHPYSPTLCSFILVCLLKSCDLYKGTD